jgi:hypothetical protein
MGFFKSDGGVVSVSFWEKVTALTVLLRSGATELVQSIAKELLIRSFTPVGHLDRMTTESEVQCPFTRLTKLI